MDFEKAKIRESLANPDAKFRHDKDRERRGRIRLAQTLRMRKRKASRIPRGGRIKPARRIRGTPIRSPRRDLRFFGNASQLRI